MNYFIESLRACKRRTLPCLNLDVETPVVEKGMSWPKSISMMIYFWIRRVIKMI